MAAALNNSKIERVRISSKDPILSKSETEDIALLAKGVGGLSIENKYLPKSPVENQKPPVAEHSAITNQAEIEEINQRHRIENLKYEFLKKKEKVRELMNKLQDRVPPNFSLEASQDQLRCFTQEARQIHSKYKAQIMENRKSQQNQQHKQNAPLPPFIGYSGNNRAFQQSACPPIPPDPMTTAEGRPTCAPFNYPSPSVSSYMTPNQLPVSSMTVHPSNNIAACPGMSLGRHATYPTFNVNPSFSNTSQMDANAFTQGNIISRPATYPSFNTSPPYPDAPQMDANTFTQGNIICRPATYQTFNTSPSFHDTPQVEVNTGHNPTNHTTHRTSNTSSYLSDTSQTASYSRDSEMSPGRYTTSSIHNISQSFSDIPQTTSFARDIEMSPPGYATPYNIGQSFSDMPQMASRSTNADIPFGRQAQISTYSTSNSSVPDNLQMIGNTGDAKIPAMIQVDPSHYNVICPTGQAFLKNPQMSSIGMNYNSSSDLSYSEVNMSMHSFTPYPTSNSHTLVPPNPAHLSATSERQSDTMTPTRLSPANRLIKNMSPPILQPEDLSLITPCLENVPPAREVMKDFA